jgi:hypothetical protein
MRGQHWSAEELQRLEDLTGNVPAVRLFGLYRNWAKRHGYPSRTNTAILCAVRRRGLTLSCSGETITTGVIAGLLGIPIDGPDRWIQMGRLRVQCRSSGNRPFRYILRSDFKLFARQYPQLLGGIPWEKLHLVLEDEQLSRQIAADYPHRPWHRKPVRCIETGWTWPTIRAAAKAHFITHQAITWAIRTGGTAAGRHWERV